MRSGIGNSASDPLFVSQSSGGVAGPNGTATDPRYYARVPSGDPSSSITPIVATASSGIVVKASPGNFYGASCVNAATAGFLIAYNATSVPASGAALTGSLILGMNVLAANGSASIDPSTVADRFNAGIVILVSTSTTTYTVPANLPFYLRGRGV